MVSILDFFATGRFGPIALGISQPALEAALDAPEDTGGGSRKCRRPSIWKYGDIEFYFDRPGGILWLVHLDRFTASGGFAQGWGRLRLDPWIVREGLAQDAFCVALKASGLKFEIRVEPQHNQEVVVLRTGIEVGFLSDPEPYAGPVGLAWVSQMMQVG